VDASLPLVYGWLKRTREVLFEYTDRLPNEVYTLEHPDFAYGSIRNIHAHVAECYLWWVGTMGFGAMGLGAGGSGRPVEEFDPSSLPDANSIRAKFAEVDALLEEAFEQFTSLDAPLEVVRPGRDTLLVSQRWLVMHPITHEFHHKGQLLALGRVLGHPLPPTHDTDLVLP
jgi:uncharacterized damage-inducible protein DinB